MHVSLLYVTLSTKAEATELARTLLAEKYIACANILPEMTSLYEWDGSLQSNGEVAMLVKTSASLKAATMQRIAELHSYDCPCIIELKTGDVHSPFAKWIFSQIRD